MTDKELLAKCLELLEQWYDGDEPRKKTQAMIVTLSERFAPSKPRLDHSLTPKYEKAKRYVEGGNSIGVACVKAGITRDQWYRRKRMEETGVDRINREYW